MEQQSDAVPESGAVTLTAEQWTEARRRAAVIGPLADSRTVSQQAAEAAAQTLGCTARSIYAYVRLWRETGGSVAALAPAKPNGGKGKSRLGAATEAIIDDVVQRLYLTVEKPRLFKVVAEVRRQCRLKALKPPSENTVKARIRMVRADKAEAKRGGSKAAFRLKPAPGATPEAAAPLDTIQMDHTKIDVQLVDPATRQPIGRPYLTVAIDGFSRCIVGICVTLEAPSATSVGLCLAHVVIEKKPWLEKLGVDCAWPMRGKPKKVYVDNAREFHSEALRRGCEVHGITLDHRPIARPHYGGIVERIIGTVMKMVHELPGTTFSNIKDRGSYDAEAKAALTLQELEKWIVLAICGPYHGEVHGTLLQPPSAKWTAGVTQFGEPPLAQNPKVFLIDFLPVEKRAIQRQGFVLDHVGYYDNALSPWIAARDRLEPFVIRRDPRDISRIWVLDPKRNAYIEVPYRTLSNPAVTMWEHRAARKWLREQGRAQVDEAAIFRAIEQMRSITENAKKQSKAARRSGERRSHLPEPTETAAIPVPIPSATDAGGDARPFAEIEEW